MDFGPFFGITLVTITVFVIGLLAGVVIKRTLKLAAAIIALAAILVATGYINLALTEPAPVTIFRVFSSASSVGSQVFELASILPISSLAFLAGAGIGFWKG